MFKQFFSLGIFFFMVAHAEDAGESKDNAPGGIKILERSLSFPSKNFFRVTIKATGSDLKSFNIRFKKQFLRGAQAPNGFETNSAGYAYPPLELPFVGDADNGKNDEDKTVGVYVRTFSTEGWESGDYFLQCAAHNGPRAPGVPLIAEIRDVAFTINSGHELENYVEKIRANVNCENMIVYKKEGVYAPFPTLMQLEKSDTLVTTFSRKMLRTHFADQNEKNQALISYNGGKDWVELESNVAGTQFRISNSHYLRFAAKGWEYVSSTLKDKLEQEGRGVRDVGRPGFVGYLSPSYYQQTSSNGFSWSKKEALAPDYVSGLQNMNDMSSFIITSKGVALRVVYGKRKATVKTQRYETFFLRSDDGGTTLRFISLLPSAPESLGFGESALIETDDGQILCVMRTDPEGFLYQAFSKDQGLTWSAPEKTPMFGWPPHLTKVGKGKILCSYGYRIPPMGIRACQSSDNGKTWDMKNEYILRADGEGSLNDVGYPISCQLSDGSLFTIYYISLSDNITHVAGTKWKIK